jgi:biopolymer transport protein ExbB
VIRMRGFLVAVLLGLLPAALVSAAVSMADLERSAEQMREREAKVWKAREEQQREEVQKQEQLAADAQARRNRADSRSQSLSHEFDANDTRLGELKDLLHQREGNLGELFGVTRQIAGDAATVLQQSMLSAQFVAKPGEEPRDEFMRRIAGAKSLPSIVELERMWFELHREMTESGKVVRFTAQVEQADKSTKSEPVVRIGPFTAFSDDGYLSYLTSTRSLRVIERPLSPSLMSLAQELHDAPGSEGHITAVVDPARGALIGMFADRPSVVERIQRGEVVGYVILLVGALGILLALGQYGYLLIARSKVTAQLNNLSNPSSDNALGRMLLAMRSARPEGEEDTVEIVELRLSEAVLREVPRLQRFQSFLRLAVAAGPLLGLIGTVIGMIVTFHAITAAGSSDPKLMAHGIGPAMIATVLGLGIAIPLLFINNGMTALSNAVTRILDEQSQALLADELARRNPFLTQELDEARRRDKT